LSRKIVNNYGIVFVEDLKVKGLSRGMLAKSVHHAGWAAFFQKLLCKAASAGRLFLPVDPRGTASVARVEHQTSNGFRIVSTSRGLPPATDKFENAQVSHDTAFVFSPTPDLSVGTPVSPIVILSRQAVALLGQAQHGGAMMHMHRLHGIGQRLILVLVGQTDAFRVGHLDFGGATSRNGCKGREIDGNLRPGLENLE